MESLDKIKLLAQETNEQSFANWLLVLLKAFILGGGAPAPDERIYNVRQPVGFPVPL